MNLSEQEKLDRELFVLKGLVGNSKISAQANQRMKEERKAYYEKTNATHARRKRSITTAIETADESTAYMLKDWCPIVWYDEEYDTMGLTVDGKEVVFDAIDLEYKKEA